MVLLTEVSWGAAALADRNEAPSDLPLRQRARPPSSQAPSRPAPQSARFHSEGHRNAINMDDLAARTDPVRRRRLRERDEVFVRPVTARETVSHVPLAPARWNGTGRQAFVTPIALEPIEKTLTPWATARAHAAAALELSRARARMAQEQRAQEVKELRADCFAKAQALIKRYTDPSSVTEGLIDDASPLGAIPSAVQQDAPPTEPNAGPAAAAPAAGMVDVASLLPSLHAARASRRRGGGGSESSKGKKSRGPYASAPLRIEALPAWKTEWPAKVGSAADRFDRAHQRRWDHAEGLILALSGDTTHLAKQEALHDVTIEIFRGRYAEPVELTGIRRYERRSAKVKPPAAKRAWKLEDSIWKPRVKWADSKGFWDSDDVERSMFECDWARAISCGLSKTIYRMDDGGNADAGSDEVTEVMDVLWEYHDLLFVIFDYYAAIGANTDVTTVSSNSFAEFATECRLVDKRSKACKIADFDRLYISVDATGGKATDERFNRKKALNRQEFVQCVVKTACMRYIESGELDDVSDAVHRLFRADLEPRLNPLIFVEPNVFRTEHAYTEEVDGALRQHEEALRLIYERMCVYHGTAIAKGIANKLVDEPCWRDFCLMFELIDADLTERDATLAFVWSRMRVVDEQTDLGRIKVTHLTFEDFLEAICRCSVCKAWPTRAEIADAGTGNAGVHMLHLKSEDPDMYDALLATRSVPFGRAPSMAMATCVEMMCELLIVTCKQRRGGSGLSLALTDKEVANFLPIHSNDG